MSIKTVDQMTQPESNLPDGPTLLAGHKVERGAIKTSRKTNRWPTEHAMYCCS